jgi:uncharacterized protein (DUF2237 family)
VNDLGNLPELNVFAEPLEPCSFKPLTGFFRDGSCSCGPEGLARHLVCVEMTADFLEFSRSRGNDLMTPNADYRFPGLQVGDRWCLHVLRWIEAFDAGMAPSVALRSTNRAVLRFIEIEKLKAYALDLS